MMQQPEMKLFFKGNRDTTDADGMVGVQRLMGWLEFKGSFCRFEIYNVWKFYSKSSVLFVFLKGQGKYEFFDGNIKIQEETSFIILAC